MRSPEHAERFQKSIQQRLVARFFNNPYAQYDGHAQVVYSGEGPEWQTNRATSASTLTRSGGDGETLARTSIVLFEDKHKNGATPNCINFYLRLTQWDSGLNRWVDRLPAIQGVDLEIDGVDPITGRALYLPVRMKIDTATLAEWVQLQRTTIIDVEMMRIASNDTFMLYGAK